MQKLLLIVAFFTCHLAYAQTLKILDTDAATHEEYVRVAPKYDSLHNIRPHQDTLYYKQFIGQSILFYPRNPNSIFLPEYYANFETPEVQVVSTDTIWHKRRKNPKPKDYDIKEITSNRYKAQFVENKQVTLCASYCTVSDEGKNIYPFNRENILSTTNGHTGYYTPYKEVEDKIFKVIDIKHSSNSRGERYSIFIMKSEEGDTVYWNAYRGEYDGVNHEEQHFPVIVLGFMEKMKQLYLNKDFYIKSIHPIEKYSCVDLVYDGIKNDYMIPSFVLKKDSSNLIMPLCESPSLFSYQINDRRNKMSVMYFCKLDIAQAEMYEEFLRKEKLAREEALEKERIAKEEAEKQAAINRKLRLQNLTKKFGAAIAKTIIRNEVEIGMSKEMVIESWGYPSGGVNKTIGAWGTHEQWVYGSRQYLYFQNGRLTTIQSN